MENAYSISVTNKFSLALDEDEDPLEILKIREQEREAKKKEKLTEKEQRAKQQEHQKQNPSSAPAKQKPRANKENQQAQNQQAQTQQVPRNQEGKKDGDRKSVQQKTGGERKFEAREEHNNRRNREDGDRVPRTQNDSRRGPPGEIRDNQNPREFRNFDSNDRRAGGRGRGGPGRGGRGGFRGGRGGFDNRGKREFDRQSGNDKTNGYSGVKSIDKKDGAGSHNWGSHTEEIEDSFNQTENWESEKVETMDATPKTNDTSDAQVGEGLSDASPAEEKPVEEEARELTLDEWKALRQTRAKPTFNLRKAGEGEDLSRWKKMYALEKKKEDNEEEEDDEEYDAAAEYPQRVGRQKHLLDIDIQFSDSRRSAGGRGGRGGRGRGERSGGRGGFNRGPVRPDNEFRAPEQRSPRERQNAPKVDDVKDFPSLAGKAH